MTGTSVVDANTALWPEPGWVSSRVQRGWEAAEPATAGDPPWDADGSALVRRMRAQGVEQAWLLQLDLGLADGVTDTEVADRLRRVSQVASSSDGRLCLFAGVDPRREGAARLLSEAVEEGGARGLVLYPPAGFAVSDEACEPLLRDARRLGLPVAVHTGAAPAPFKSRYGNPLEVERAAARHPEVEFVMLYSGYRDCWREEAVQVAAYKPNVWCDVTGWDYGHGGPAELARRLARVRDMAGPERLLTGSGSVVPATGFDRWLATLRRLPSLAPDAGVTFSEQEVAMLLGGNARRLLGRAESRPKL